MPHFKNILFLIVFAFWFFNDIAIAKPIDSYHVVVSVSTENQLPSNIYSGNRPDLFGIHNQDRGSVNLLRIFPLPIGKSSEDRTTKTDLISELKHRQAISVYLFYSKDFDRSLTLKKLLFPFHHFL
jgi:hypothetical protein